MAGVDPAFSDISVLLTDLAPEARSKALAEFAQEVIAETDAQNDAALGYDVQYETLVDGRKTQDLASVRADGGVIVADWDLSVGVFQWVADQLKFLSPRLTGRYEASHDFYADDQPADPSKPPPAESYVFINAQPYARKIERGLSNKAPDGVYQVVATQAARQFGNLAIIRFTYRNAPGVTYQSKKAARADRQPAVLILLR